MHTQQPNLEFPQLCVCPSTEDTPANGHSPLSASEYKLTNSELLDPHGVVPPSNFNKTSHTSSVVSSTIGLYTYASVIVSCRFNNRFASSLPSIRRFLAILSAFLTPRRTTTSSPSSAMIFLM